MSNENQAFEKWYEYQIPGNETWKDGLRLAWQAAKADSAQESANIKSRALEESNKYVAYCDLAEKRIAELQAHINILREALEEIAFQAETGWIDEALAQTPAQSLQAFENEVIERCAKVCELQRELQYKTGGDENAISQTYRDADAIRALKGVAHE